MTRNLKEERSTAGQPIAAATGVFVAVVVVVGFILHMILEYMTKVGAIPKPPWDTMLFAALFLVLVVVAYFVARSVYMRMRGGSAAGKADTGGNSSTES